MPVDKAHVQRLLIFYLSDKVDDPEKMLNHVAAEAHTTRDEVWQIYTDMVKVSLGL